MATIPEDKTSFTFNHADQPDNYGQVAGSGTTVKAAFDSRAEELRELINLALAVLREHETGIGAKLPLTGGILTGGAEILTMKAGATLDHVYLGLYADSQAQATRSGVIGYTSAGSSVLAINNQVTGGNVSVSTTGGGKFVVNGNAGVLDSGATQRKIWAQVGTTVNASANPGDFIIDVTGISL